MNRKREEIQVQIDAKRHWIAALELRLKSHHLSDASRARSRMSLRQHQADLKQLKAELAALKG